MHELPFSRPDGTEVEYPGYDVKSGWWATLPPETIALPSPEPTILAGQLLELGRGNFDGDMTAIAAELFRRYGVTWNPKSLQCKIKQGVRRDFRQAIRNAAGVDATAKDHVAKRRRCHLRGSCRPDRVERSHSAGLRTP